MPLLAFGQFTPGYFWQEEGAACALRRPGQEVADHLETDGLAFLWVELHSDHRVAADNGGDVLTIFHMRQTFMRVLRLQMVGMNEINVVA